MYKHIRVTFTMFNLRNNDTNIFHHESADTPDDLVDEESREVTNAGGSCTPDSSVEEAFVRKALQYKPLVTALEQHDYCCRLLVFIFGILGNLVRGLQLAGLSKLRAKQLARLTSMSAK